VKAELEKQWNVGFVKVVKYPQWVSNIVVVPNKEGKIRVCLDFRNLNKASPKDDFLLSHINILVDNAARSVARQKKSARRRLAIFRLFILL